MILRLGKFCKQCIYVGNRFSNIVDKLLEKYKQSWINNPAVTFSATVGSASLIYTINFIYQHKKIDYEHTHEYYTEKYMIMRPDDPRVKTAVNPVLTKWP